MHLRIYTYFASYILTHVGVCVCVCVCGGGGGGGGVTCT